MSGLNDGTATCNVKEIVEGVRFRLYQVTALSGAELADEARLRNVAAYKFFLAAGVGTDLARDPFGAAPPAKSLTDVPLADCDVPLALLHWTNAGGLRWVDPWAVRRRMAWTPADADPTWGPVEGAARAALGTAMVMQFQAHLADLRLSAGSGFTAMDAFNHLPPIGMIPVQGFGGGLDLAKFFGGLKRRDPPAFVDGAKLPSLFDDAVRFPPIDLLAKEKELIWTYFVRENIRAGDVATATGPQACLIFTHGQAPYRGDARFDLAYWGYANYALE